MRLRVHRVEGGIETITLVPPVTLTLTDSGFNILTDASGMEYWFTQDGLYEGWGMTSPKGGWSYEQSRQIIERVEHDRETEEDK